MDTTVRRTVAAVLLIASLHATAESNPRRPDSPHHDRDGATVATPWIDLAPSKLLDDLTADRDTELLDRASPRDHKVAASLTLAGLYAGFTTWTYFAWYRNKVKNADMPDRAPFEWGGDGLFGKTTYAGGADKLGHAWATMGLARGGTELLHQWGGFEKLTASAISCGLAETLFFFVEVKDGAYYEFSFGDFAFNSLGAAFAFAASNLPKLDRLVDYRVQYWPSHAYRDQLTHDGNVNIAEDYTGQTYLLAFKPGGIDRLARSRLGFLRFANLAVGFETRGYKPDQIPGNPDFLHTQKLFVGITIDAQAVFDALLHRRPIERKLTHGLFEMFNLPFSTLPVVEGNRDAMNVDIDGA